MAELLLQQGYRVIGAVRPPLAESYPRLAHIQDAIELTEGDLLNQSSLEQLLRKHRPTQVYNFAAIVPSSFQSFGEPLLTGELNGLGVLRLLEAIRAVDPAIRFCQASSCTMFGKAREAPQRETTPFYPNSPYAVAKLYGHWITVNYRESHRMFACSAILFNHESPRRPDAFVSRKIARAVAAIKAGIQHSLPLRNIDGLRDWGYAVDYVHAMWLMLQAPVADDYVLATGEAHSVREFCRIAFEHVGLDFQRYVVQDKSSDQAAQTVQMVGDPRKAQRALGWRPTLSFPDLVRLMVDAEIAALTCDGTT